MSTPRTVPFGLEWARRLADPAIGERSDEQEVFRLTLIVGLLAAGGAVYGVAVPLMVVLAPITVPIMVAGTVVCIGGLALVLRQPARAPLVVNGVFAFVAALAFAITVVQGGIVPSGANVIWALLAPVISMLIFGRREAAIWFIVFVVGTTAIVAAPYAGFALPPPPALDPEPVTVFNLGLFGLLLMLAVTWFVQQRAIAERLLEVEREKSEALLINVLPEEVAGRLKDGMRIADAHGAASVLFADLVGFTPLSSILSAGEVLTLLHDLFREFDAIVAHHGVEKIKTIGDCYMMAAGVPHSREDHAEVLVAIALELQELLVGHAFAGHDVQMRIGVHSGPLMAGVIGDKRLVYDLWGDTVNTASRMESSGVPGRTQITEQTAELVEHRFELEERGMIEIKGKGALRTFFVVGPR